MISVTTFILNYHFVLWTICKHLLCEAAYLEQYDCLKFADFAGCRKIDASNVKMQSVCVCLYFTGKLGWAVKRHLH